MSIKDLQTDQQPIEVKHLQARFIQLEQELIAATPELPNALAEIHKQLQQHEELTHLLDDDDCKNLHQSFELFKQHKMIANVQKEIKKKGKKLSESQLNNI